MDNDSENKPHDACFHAMLHIARDSVPRELLELLQGGNACALFELFMRHLPGVAFIKDLQGQYLYVNQGYDTIIREDLHSSCSQCRAQDLWCPASVAMIEENDRKVLERNGAMRFVERLRPKSGGKEYILEVLKFPIWGEGKIIALGGLATDISRRQRTERALLESEQSYRIVAEYTYDWETWVGPEGVVRFVSPACEEITGYPRENFVEDLGYIEEVLHLDDLQAYRNLMTRLDEGQENGQMEFRVVRPDGRERWINMHARRVYDNKGTYLGLRLSCRDFTDRKLLELRLQHEAFHDPLTGLPNRTLCLDRITQALERSKRRENYHYAVIFLDLDRFKLINDSLGHSIGDQLLQSVAQRLQENVRSLDTVARLGGDEFIVLLEEIVSVREAIRIVKRLRNAVRRPFDISGHDVHVTASIGIVLSPAIYDKPEDLLRNANIAMHRAKELGRNRFKVFHSRMLEEAIRLMRMENDLRLALVRQEFFLLYQPILSLESGNVTGLEALVRWRHPVKGVMEPDQFLPIAEDTGLVIPLGLWVLREACSKMAQWRKEVEDVSGLTMNVNLSLKQLRHPELLEKIGEILCDTGLPPHTLKLEVPETVLMDNPEIGIIMLSRLKTLGVQLSIDDFGSGYSSLSYLQRFPIDTLKVDRTFIKRMGNAASNKEVVRAVIALAHSLNLDVVAEGVEVEEQRVMLSDLQCEGGQGYLFSRPVEQEIAGKLLLPNTQKFSS